MEYIFKSERPGFRNWRESDIDVLAEMNADEEVMEFFPDLISREESIDFISRMQKQFSVSGFCYFAVEELETNELIGFTGLSEQNFEADFTPCIDIGWRLKRSAWNRGYATEGAKACIGFAFAQLKIEKVYAIAPLINKRSELVMKKAGMERVRTFRHPKLQNDERLEDCVLYVIRRGETGAFA